MPVEKYVENITKNFLDTSSKIELIFVTKLIIKRINIRVGITCTLNAYLNSSKNAKFM